MTTGVPAYSTTPASNVQANTGINWDEGMSPGAVNNSARANMADLRTAFNDLIWFQYGSGTSPVVTPAYASGTSFTVAGIDVTTPYHAGRRVKAVGSGTGTIYGSISSSSFSTNTTVNVTWDSGSLTNEALTIYLAQVPVTGKPIPSTAISGLVTTEPTQQILTSGSSATYTTPAGARQLRIRAVGGGGGGGAGDSSVHSGGAGGDTSFNSVVAKGGSAGTGGTSAANGNGGAGGTGGSGSATRRVNGNAGSTGCGTSLGAADFRPGGQGAPGPWGGAPINVGPAGTAAAANTGAGGSGGGFANGGSPGGGGGAGEYYELTINSPSGTYTYTIGAAGAASTLGSQNGGAGGTGVIIVDEIY